MFAKVQESISELDEILREEALCRKAAAEGLVVADLFFSEQIDDIARAKSICALCPVSDACLRGAIQRQEPWGVWGGELFLNGKIIAQKRRRGRPSKQDNVQLSA